MTNRVHWPSLLALLILFLLAIWVILRLPVGPQDFCEMQGREWFEEIGRCL